MTTEYIGPRRKDGARRVALGKSRPELTAPRLREVLAYDPETGVFTWLIRPRPRTPAGSEAGYNSGPYRLIGIDQRIYYAHRLAWLYVTGEWPVSDIDHADRDGLNNRWANLREATHSQNNWNMAPRPNQTGFKGVRIHSKTGRYVGCVRHLGKAYTTRYFQTPDEADSALRAIRERLHGEFARHA